MTGSNAVLFVVPIVMLAALGLWLGLVYYVGAHPEWKGHRMAREAQAREAAAVAAGPPPGDQAVVPARGQAGVPAGGQKPGTPRAA